MGLRCVTALMVPNAHKSVAHTAQTHAEWLQYVLTRRPVTIAEAVVGWMLGAISKSP